MAIYQRLRYLFMTTDPVHIGTGGYRLGRVDNSIVREPGTRLPKIPGTSLHGAVRSYAAQLYETPEAAGQSQDNVREPDNNPVCYTFGYIKKTTSGNQDETQAYSGVVNIFDAHIVLFPVHSMAGPVWVSTIERMQDAGFMVDDPPANLATDAVLLTWERKDALNLGWLMVNTGGKVAVKAPGKWGKEGRWQTVKDRIVLVHNILFSQIVNSNLEVRTSVAIDPERGAAENQLLFTYEAIPRATFLTAEVVLDDYRSDDTGWPLGEVIETKPQNRVPKPLPGGSWKGPLDVTEAGLRMIEWLGVGGMGTRGFGRMALVGAAMVQSPGQEGWQ